MGVENRFHVDVEGFQTAGHFSQAAYRAPAFISEPLVRKMLTRRVRFPQFLQVSAHDYSRWLNIANFCFGCRHRLGKNECQLKWIDRKIEPKPAARQGSTNHEVACDEHKYEQ
jgi:hypothetical protein